MPSLRFRPVLFDGLRHYRSADLLADLGAGITVACVALPLAMAFAIASGVRPEQGLISAIIGGLLVSLLGGSRVQIGGPAGAFVTLLFGIGIQYGAANLALATLLAGLLLLLMGVLNLGRWVRFVPLPIILGFTNGIAVIIGFSQLRDFAGLQIETMPAHFSDQLVALWTHRHTLNGEALALAMATLCLLFIWPRAGQPRTAASRWRSVLARIPGPLVALLAASTVAAFFGLRVDTIGSRFGEIAASLPAPVLPTVSLDNLRVVLIPALSIAVLGAIESLLCARVADGLTHDRHNPDQELMAQGIANMAVPLFGGIAVTGTIARTVTNIRSGARTPVAGLTHAVVLLLIVLLLAPVAAQIPMAALAAILLHVAFNMGDWALFRTLNRHSPSYRLELVATFLLTVIFDLTIAIQVGLLLACASFILRVGRLTQLEPLALAPADQVLPDGRSIAAWTVRGALFFGVVGKLDALQSGPPEHPTPSWVLLDLSVITTLDSSALDVLTTLHESLQRQGGGLICCGVRGQPHNKMRRSGFADQLGPQGLMPSVAAALRHLQGVSLRDVQDGHS